MNHELIEKHLKVIDACYEEMMKGIALNSNRNAIISEAFEIAKARYNENHPVVEEKVEEVKPEIKAEEKKPVEHVKENKPETKVNTDQLLKWAKRQ